MLINTWYVAGESADLTTTPRPVRMLGQDFVLFRDTDGKAHCLSNVCIHRGGALCDGKIIEGSILCPYHGWRFNGDGACVEIPSLHPDAKIPKRARIDSYPVKEQWGWVFVFLGDLPESERPEIPGPDLFPEYDDHQNGSDAYAFVRGVFTFDANWVRAIDNVLDPAHAFHVHSAFGNPDSQYVPPFKVETSAQHTLSRHRFVPVNKTGKWREEIPDDREDTDNQIQFHFPGMLFRNDMYPRAGMHHFVISGYLPVNEHETINFFIHGRNFAKDPEYDEDGLKRVVQVLEEDQVVLRKVKPVMMPPRTTDELLIEADMHLLEFRKKVKEYEDRGWRIDSKAVAGDEERVYVIPSPARGRDPKNWVHKTVPMRTGRPAAKAAE